MEMGLVDQVSEDPMAEIEAWAERELAPKSAEALRWAVRASRWQFNRIMRDQLKQVERLYLEDLMSTHDANEGLAAFLEKRKPSWTNH
jgi:cyclohexa-1,5-dienecarbonyl-CoA hydratase